MDNLVALFREQLAVIKQQMDTLQGLGVQLPTAAQPSAVAAPVADAHALSTTVKVPNLSNLVAEKVKPVAAAAAAAAPVASDIAPRILASVSRISAFPEGTLKLEQSLTGELGFDSLMLVELDQDIGKAWPKLGGLPRELFTPKTTIGDVIAHVTTALSKAATAPVSEVAAAAIDRSPVARYAPVWVPAPLVTLPESVVAFESPILVTQGPLAEALVEELSNRGVRAQLGQLDSPGTFSGVIVLGSGPEALHAVAALAKRFTDVELFFTATTHAGALGFTRALAQERPTAHIKAICLDGSATAKTLVDEVFATDATVELSLGKSGRTVVELKSLSPSPQTRLTAHSNVLVTGGAKGLGLAFAKAISERYGSKLTLTGPLCESRRHVGAWRTLPADARTTASIPGTLRRDHTSGRRSRRRSRRDRRYEASHQAARADQAVALRRHRLVGRPLRQRGADRLLRGQRAARRAAGPQRAHVGHRLPALRRQRDGQAHPQLSQAGDARGRRHVPV